MKKTMKRSLSVILAILMLMTAVPFVNAAFGKDCPECQKRTDFQIVPRVEPTCDDGHEEGIKCSVCGYTEGCAVIPGTGNHDWDKVKKGEPASCIKPGKMESKQCKVCKKYFDKNNNKIADTEEELVIPAAHTLGGWEVTIPATCTTKGKETRSCSKCDFSEEREIDEKGHAFGEWHDEQPATCTADGIAAYKQCSNCNKYFDENEDEIPNIVLPKVGHHDDPETVDWTYSENFNCTVGGTRAKHCHCGVVLATEEVAPAAHPSPYDTISSTEPTCSEEGSTVGMKCSICGTVGLKPTPIPAKGHKIGDTLEKVEAVEAKCEEAGNIEHYRCKDCKGYFVVGENEAITEVQEADVVTAALGHQPESVAKLPATCKEKGNEEGVACARCGEILSGCAEISEIKHTVETNLELQAAVAAKCDAVGNIEHYRCKKCGKLFVVEDEEFVEKTQEEITLAATGHKEDVNLDKTVKKPETCTVAGNIEYYTCKDCNKLLEKAEDGTFSEITQEQTVIPAGHRFSPEWEEIEATCTKEGSKWHECTREGCNEKDELTTIPKKEHAYLITETPVTCTKDGEKIYECKECGDYRVEVLKSEGKHTDLNTDGKCDVCGEQTCGCLCHKSGIFYKLIYFVCKVWWEYLGIKSTCDCGAVHYSKTVF